MLTPRAFRIARRRRGFASGSPPPRPAAIEISRMIWVKILPRLASAAPFLRLIVAHFEWPDMAASRGSAARGITPRGDAVNASVRAVGLPMECARSHATGGGVA